MTRIHFKNGDEIYIQGNWDIAYFTERGKTTITTDDGVTTTFRIEDILYTQASEDTED